IHSPKRMLIASTPRRWPRGSSGRSRTPSRPCSMRISPGGSTGHGGAARESMLAQAGARIPSAHTAGRAYSRWTMSTPPSAAGSPAAELLRAVVAGAPEAVDAWFRAEHPAVFRLCFGFLAHRADAEDVAQEAMLQLLDRLGSWDTTHSYRAWRTTLVLNRCRDRVRRRGVRREAE